MKHLVKMIRGWFSDSDPAPTGMAIKSAFDGVWAEIYKLRDDLQEQIDRLANNQSDTDQAVRELQSNERNRR